MAFPTEWNRKCSIVIDHDKVYDDLTNYPCLITENNLPSEIFTLANVDGSDIRFTSDESGDTELSREIVSFDTGGETAEIWTKIPSISASVDTTIYIWYNNSGASEPAAGASNGKYAVWSDYALVYHFNESDPSAGSIADSTENQNTGTVHNMESDDDEVCPYFGRCWDFSDGSEYITIPDHASLDISDDFGYEALVKSPATFATYHALTAMNAGTGSGTRRTYIYADATSGNFLGQIYGATKYYSENGNFAFSSNTWYLLNFGYDVSGNQGVTSVNQTDHSSAALGSQANAGAGSGDTYIAEDNRETGYYWIGKIAEFRIGPFRNHNWHKTFYDNTIDNSNFATAGTPEDTTTEYIYSTGEIGLSLIPESSYEVEITTEYIYNTGEVGLSLSPHSNIYGSPELTYQLEDNELVCYIEPDSDIVDVIFTEYSGEIPVQFIPSSSSYEVNIFQYASQDVPIQFDSTAQNYFFCPYVASSLVWDVWLGSRNTILWGIEQKFTGPTLLWDIQGDVTSSLILSWDILSDVTGDLSLDLKWDILDADVVEKQLTLIWDIQSDDQYGFTREDQSSLGFEIYRLRD